MPSQLKIETARRNGARSRGPKSAEGKQKSSLNAVSHGLTASHMFVLRNESEGAWQHLLHTCVQHFQPASDYELDLVREIAAARWRMRRAWTVETGLFDLEMDKQDAHLRERFHSFDEGTRLACAFAGLADSGRSLGMLSRYETRLSRNLERAVASLHAHRNRKAQNEPTALAQEPQPPRHASLSEDPHRPSPGGPGILSLATGDHVT